MAVTIPLSPARLDAAGGVDVEALRRELAASGAEVRTDAAARATHAVDSSNYRLPPLAVVLPHTPEEVVDVVAACRAHRVPLVSRGGGTSLSGQTTGSGVVVDWSRHCHRLLSVDPEARRAVVEPGIVLDELDRQLRPHGLMYGPRPAPHWTCTLGGMIGNNSCGATAQTYGKTVDNVHRLEVLLADGTRMWVGPTSDEEYAGILAAGGRRAEVYRGLRRLRDEHLAAIRTGYPHIPRRVSGYGLDSLLPEAGFDVARALVGSEGTLVTVLRAELALVPLPRHTALVALAYRDVVAAARAVPALDEEKPHRLEGWDRLMVDLEHQQGVHADALGLLPDGGGWLLVEVVGDSDEEAEQAARRVEQAARKAEPPPEGTRVVTDADGQRGLWEVRESALGATAHPPGRRLTWPGWDDAAVAPERLGDYLADFQQLLEEYGYAEDSSIYGHFGHGCIHVSIPFDLATAPGIAAFRSFVERCADLVVSYGGSLSGEHGDGVARGELLGRMFGPELMRAMRELKTLLDPDGLLNPGKVVDPLPLDAQLRLGTGFAPDPGPTAFGYPDDGGSFTRAVLRCVGVGKCRREGVGEGDGHVMCPSYRATGQEEHSTRGRARLLFEMLRGEVVTDGWRSEAVRDALDLCLACKGCKSDCPVGTDMATYKAEFLHHHYAGRLRPREHYAMGWLPIAARAAAMAPGAVDAVLRGPLAPLVKRAAGVAPQRSLPAFAPERFSGWFRRRPLPPRAPRGDVLLWPDTFTDSFAPQIGRAAVEVLEAAGFRVRLPEQPLCCGLTWISTGQLGVARRVLGRTVRALAPAVRAGVPVVGLEPSCTAVLASDAAQLFPHDEDVHRLGAAVHTLAGTLADLAPDWQPPRLDREAVVQTHCHQHAVLGVDAEHRLHERVGLSATEAGGCCGLAGDFGFTAGHYEVSMACAEQSLLPKVRAASPGTAVVADGFSCRTQLQQSDLDCRPVHLAELLAGALAR